MSDMPDDALTVEPTASFARRDGADVRVVLTLADCDVAGPEVWLRFQGDGRGARVRAAPTPSGADVRIEATVPEANLGPGIWRLKLRAGAGSPLRNLRARLLISDAQPIALLPGQAPKTRMTDHAT